MMMARHEKLAWYNLTVFAVTVAVFIPLYLKFGYPAVGTFALCSLWAFGPLFFFPRGRMSAFMDERDLDIQRRSALQGFAAFWGVFIGVTMLIVHFKRGSTIPVDRLPVFIFAAMMIHMVVSSIVAIVMYRHGAPSGKE